MWWASQKHQAFCFPGSLHSLLLYFQIPEREIHTHPTPPPPFIQTPQTQTPKITSPHPPSPSISKTKKKQNKNKKNRIPPAMHTPPHKSPKDQLEHPASKTPQRLSGVFQNLQTSPPSKRKRKIQEHQTSAQKKSSVQKMRYGWVFWEWNV